MPASADIVPLLSTTEALVPDRPSDANPTPPQAWRPVLVTLSLVLLLLASWVVVQAA